MVYMNVSKNSELVH